MRTRDPEVVAFMVDMRRRGLTARGIAAELNALGHRNVLGKPWTRDAVEGVLRDVKVFVPQNHRVFTSAEMDRVRALTAEGLLSSWIAEDFGVNKDRIARIAHRLPGAEEKNREWKIVWAQIKNKPELVELHQEFAPKRKRAIA